MAKIPYFAQLPQGMFWALGILTPLTYIVAGTKGFVASNFNWKGFPLPSTVVAQPPTRYYFGWTSLAVLTFLVMLIWRIYKFYKPNKFAKKETKNTVLVISACVTLLMATLAYFGMSFWSMGDDPLLHVKFHAGFFVCMVIFVILIDVIISATKEHLVKWTIIYDAIMSLFVTAYLITGYFVLFKGTKSITLSNVAVFGYFTVLMTFARFPILGFQMYGKALITKMTKKN